MAGALGHACGSCEQVQIVVSEYDGDPVPVLVSPAQHIEGGRSTIDEVSGEPKPVSFRTPSRPREKSL